MDLGFTLVMGPDAAELLQADVLDPLELGDFVDVVGLDLNVPMA